MIRLRTSRDGWRDVFVSDSATNRVLGVEPTQGRPYYRQGGVVVVQLAGLASDRSRPDSFWLLVDTETMPGAASTVLAMLGAPDVRDLAHRALTGDAEQRDRSEAELSALAATAEMMVLSVRPQSKPHQAPASTRAYLPKTSVLFIGVVVLVSSFAATLVGSGLVGRPAPAGSASQPSGEISEAALKAIERGVAESLREALSDPSLLAALRPPGSSRLADDEVERLTSEFTKAIESALEGIEIPGTLVLTDEQIEDIVRAIRQPEQLDSDRPDGLQEEEQPSDFQDSQEPDESDQRSA